VRRQAKLNVAVGVIDQEIRVISTAAALWWTKSEKTF
jgi:hypothetical protein